MALFVVSQGEGIVVVRLSICPEIFVMFKFRGSSEISCEHKTYMHGASSDPSPNEATSVYEAQAIARLAWRKAVCESELDKARGDEGSTLPADRGLLNGGNTKVCVQPDVPDNGWNRKWQPYWSENIECASGSSIAVPAHRPADRPSACLGRKCDQGHASSFEGVKDSDSRCH